MADLDYVKVVGRLGITRGDGPDAGDEPDTVWCDEGSVIFEPVIPEMKVVGGTEGPFTVGNAAITATVDAQGWVTFNDQPFVWLLDLGSDKVNPRVDAGKATYKVSFSGVKCQGVKVSFTAFSFRPIPGQDNDLTVLSPVPAAGGTPIVQGPQGVSVVDAEVAAGELLLTLDDPDGTVVNAGALPVGPGGSDDGVAAYLADAGSATYAAADTATTALVNDDTSALHGSLTAAIDNGATAAAVRGGSAIEKPVKLGAVLAPGSAGAFDAGKVESLNPYFDAHYGLHLAPYVGYSDGAPETSAATIGWASSADGLVWTKRGVMLAASGVSGAPDEHGATGPAMIVRNGVRYLFYIGLTALGYEAGAKSLCVATQPAGQAIDPDGWTRHGAILTPSGAASGPTAWRGGAVWHPCIVENAGVTYCFINASDNTGGSETVGLAQNTTGDLTNPAAWVWRDDISPIWLNQDGSSITGDPSLVKIDGGWLACIYRAGPYGPGASFGAVDFYYTTTDDAFPLGWVPMFSGDPALTMGAVGSIDELYAHKGMLYTIDGVRHHFYTAVSAGEAVRQVAVACWPPRLRPNRYFAQVASTDASPAVCLSGVDGGWGTVPGFQVTINAEPGDVIEFGCSGVATSQASDLHVNANILKSGTVVRRIAPGNGVSGWFCMGGQYIGFGGTYPYVVQADEPIDGQVTLELALMTPGPAARSVLNNVEDVLTIWARNRAARH